MNEIQGFGTRYSPYSINQIDKPVNSDRMISYGVIAQKLLGLCQDDDIKEKMRRNIV